MADKYLAAVFPDGESAREGLHALWRLDTSGDVTVHGAVLVRRNKLGEIVVVQKDTNAPWRTAAGLALGALIGALAGPVGAAAGAVRGAAIGATAGGVVGVTADIAKADTNKQALVDSAKILPLEHYAVIAEIGESWDEPVDRTMGKLGGKIYRRATGDVRNDKWDDINSVLFPFDYEPKIVSET